MPKISAPTVAEHRDTQVRAILDAAHALLDEHGKLPALGHVAERAGLARPSLYQYFPSRGDLLLALAADATPRWIASLREAMTRQEDPVEQVQAYFVASIGQLLDGGHLVGELLSAESGLEQASAEQAQRLHDEAVEPLVEALTTLGAEQPEAVAQLLNAVLHAAGGLLTHGMDRDRAQRLLRDLTEPYLRTLPGAR